MIRFEDGRPSLPLWGLAAVLALVFIAAALIWAPAHYARALVVTILIAHGCNYAFRGQHAWSALRIGVIGYGMLLLSAVLRGLPVDFAEALWMLGLFAAGASLTLAQSLDLRRRLRHLVRLFEHAEGGDFTRAFEVSPDDGEDAITRVGHAYNRVRAQLSSMVLTDALTGCLNRRGFDQSLLREVARAARAGGEFALLAIDLDHFKTVNDTYGHLAGDTILREVGAMLVGSARAGDIVARVGGEEFAILLPETGSAGALLFAERLCERIRTRGFVLSPERMPVSVTTSIGVAVGRPRGEAGFSSLLWSRADDTLYEAKRAGRDCVREWNERTRSSGSYMAIPSDSGDQFRSHA